MLTRSDKFFVALASIFVVINLVSAIVLFITPSLGTPFSPWGALLGAALMTFWATFMVMNARALYRTQELKKQIDDVITGERTRIDNVVKGLQSK